MKKKIVFAIQLVDKRLSASAPNTIVIKSPILT